MTTTQDDILEWLARGEEEGATHVIVVCDTFDWSDYPVYFSCSYKKGERGTYSKTVNAETDHRLQWPACGRYEARKCEYHGV